MVYQITQNQSMRFNIFLLIIITILLLTYASMRSRERNHYILHTNSGDIHCTYHNSRDLNNGWMVYYDLAGEQKHLAYHKLDSVTVITEDWLTCGPKDPNMKYITKPK